MTPVERQEQFNRLFEAIPGRNIDRIRKVCELMHYKENTIRIWRMKHATRIIPERQLRVLADRLSAHGIAVANTRQAD